MVLTLQLVPNIETATKARSHLGVAAIHFQGLFYKPIVGVRVEIMKSGPVILSKGVKECIDVIRICGIEVLRIPNAFEFFKKYSRILKGP